MNHTSLAIITARGGSKRIPRKNIKEFCGKPIIAYSIEAALESNCFDTVMVSTDDEEIANISKQYGADVPFLRSTKNSDDFASTVDVLKEVLLEYKSHGKQYETACCLYPTAPFVTSEKIKKGMDMLKEAETVIPIVCYSFPPQRSVVIEEGFIKPKWQEFMSWRSQDLPSLYHDCGQFYCIRVKEFLESGQLITNNTKAIEMAEIEVQDIDNEQDWELAELKYKYLLSRGQNGKY